MNADRSRVGPARSEALVFKLPIVELPPLRCFQEVIESKRCQAGTREGNSHDPAASVAILVGRLDAKQPHASR